MKRRKFVIDLSKVVGGYLGVAVAGSIPQLIRINDVVLGEARAQGTDLCVCEANDACICEGTDLAVCPADGNSEACVPDVCTVQDGCASGDATVRVCRVRDVCEVDVSGDCRDDSCTADSSDTCIGDVCTSDSSNTCTADQCLADSSGACRNDQCESDKSGACVTDSCVSDKSGDCRTDRCASDSSGACLVDDCISDSSGYGADDRCESDSSGACRADLCTADGSSACLTDNCVSDSSGACTGDQCTADSSGACNSDHCTSDKSGTCNSDHCWSDKSRSCVARDVCVSDSSGSCDVDVCRADSGGDCATRDVCATDTTPAGTPDARLGSAMRWLFRVGMVLLAVAAAPEVADAATVIDASDTVFSATPVFQTAQPVTVADPVGAFIRDCDSDGVDEADTNGDGACAGDPELRDYNADGSRELPDGTPFAGTFRFTCFQLPSDVALITTGPVTIESSGDVGIHGAVYSAAGFTVAAQGRIDLRTSAWLIAPGSAPVFRTALAGEIDQISDLTGDELPTLGFAGVCGAIAAVVAEAIPALGPAGWALLVLLMVGATALVQLRPRR